MRSRSEVLRVRFLYRRAGEPQFCQSLESRCKESVYLVFSDRIAHLLCVDLMYFLVCGSRVRWRMGHAWKVVMA